MTRVRLTYVGVAMAVIVSAGLAALAVVLSTIKFGLGSGFLPGPILAMAIVFYWSTQETYRLPALPVFVFGIMLDLAGGGPVGFWPMLLLLGYALTLQQRRLLKTQGFAVQWLGFAVVGAAMAVIVWLLGSAIAWQALDWTAIVWNTGFAVLAYPLVAGLCGLFSALGDMLTGYAGRI